MRLLSQPEGKMYILARIAKRSLHFAAQLNLEEHPPLLE